MDTGPFYYSDITLLPLRRLLPQQVLDEEIVHFVHFERAAEAVCLARQVKLFEVLVRFHQGADNLQGGSRIDVVVQFAVDQEQLAFQAVSIVDIGGGAIRGVDRIAHPLFVPPDFIHPVVMATAKGDRNLIEIVMEQQSRHRILTSGRPAIDAGTIQIHVLVLRTCRFHPGDTIRETGIFQVLPAYIMESLRAVGCPHPVDRNDDEAEFYQFGDQMMGRLEILIHMRIVRAGLDKLYDRI